MKINRFTRLVIVVFLILILFNQITKAEDDLVNLQVRGASIRDVLVMLTEQSGINMVPDETVQGQVTINLKNVSLEEAINTLTTAYHYKFNKLTDNVYLVSKNPFNKPPKVEIENGILSLEVEDNDIRNVLNIISDKADLNMIIDDSVSGKVSVNLHNVPLNVGLTSFLTANGFSLTKNEDIYRVMSTGGGQNNKLAISIIDGKVTIDVQQANLADIIRTISRLSGVNMVMFGGVRAVLDLKLDQIPLDEAIEIMLSGTQFTYRKLDEVYMIGDKNVNSPASNLFTTSEIIPLEFLQVEKVPKLLPNNFPASNVKIIKQQNAILATGTQSQISNLKEYIEKIDIKIPQIVVDALIIEVSHNQNSNPALQLGMNYNDEDETVLFDSSLGKLTYKSVLDLPSDFYLKVKSLVEKGVATVKARPNITTLNGQQAKIDVGTVQYYKVVNTDDDGNEETKYQSINAGVTLDVTPWVSSSGEITLKLQPTVSNIGGAATEGPPKISRREINTTVRVKDGQTIILGGLIQDVGSNSNSKVPILGDLPFVGSLFQSENKNVNQTELVIYITPHVLETETQRAEEDLERMEEKVEKIKKGDIDQE